jgi:integrase
LRYRCPKTGRSIVKSAGTTNRKEAQKLAGKWEEELRTGRYKPASRLTWDEFRHQYETECVIPDMRDSTLTQVGGIFDTIERVIGPELLTDIDADAIQRLRRILPEERISRPDGTIKVHKRSTATQRNHLAVLRAALNWAKEREILDTVPKFAIPTIAANPSKGRPLTLEEFERMIAAVQNNHRKGWQAAKWERFLWGLWWSGLRLEEALTLTWDDWNAPRIELDGDNSTITIPAGCQKNGTNTVGPIVPEFFEFLSQIPEADRTGFVFDLPCRGKNEVCRIVSRIGKAAGIKVKDKGGRGGKPKFATCHDLRRSFGLRWALRVMPVLLKSLMRHSDINTTMQYYVGNNVAEMTRAVWAAYRSAEIQRGNIPGNTVQETPQKTAQRNESKFFCAFL